MSAAVKYNIRIWATIIFIIAAYPTQAFSAPPSLQARLEDGVVLKVHIQQGLDKQGYCYARQVLQSACVAYKEIVFKQGFNRPDYTFAKPTEDFVYDRDRTIDIYIANVEAPFALMAPEGPLEYKARIFLPADYKTYQKRYNITNPELELKASVIHELFHIITYTYNRNMQTISQGKVWLTDKRWDWYNEGLARYFETLVGYRDEFLSCGFRKSSGRVTQIYRGGVNYFLRYPDMPLNERKYDFALFWQYVHQKYGMDKIEEISFKFRQINPQVCSNQEAMEIVAQTLDIPLKNLLRNFSLYVYKISSLSAKAENELSPVTISKLSSRKKSTTSNICSFGYDLYEVDLKQNDISCVQLKTLGSQENLNCLIAIRSPFNFVSMPVESDSSGKIKIDTTDFLPNSKLIIMLSNPAEQPIAYRISLN